MRGDGADEPMTCPWCGEESDIPMFQLTKAQAWLEQHVYDCDKWLHESGVTVE